MEIAAKVVHHLDIRRIINLIRVSRRWAIILSSPAVFDHFLKPWCSQGQKLWVDLFAKIHHMSIIAKRALAFEWGNPSGIAMFYVPDLTTYSYNEEMLVYVGHETRGKFIALNLRDGSEHVLILPNREQINNIAVSSMLVAASTLDGKVYVWKRPLVRNQSPRSIRLESASTIDLVAAGSTLAISSNINSLPDNDVDYRRISEATLTTLYSADGDKVRSWQRGPTASCQCKFRSPMLHEDGRYLYYIEPNRDKLFETRLDHFCVIRCDLQGQVLNTWPFKCPCKTGLCSSVMSRRATVGRGDPTIIRSVSRLSMGMEGAGGLSSDWELNYYSLNSAGDDLALTCHPIQLPFPVRAIDPVFWWNHCVLFKYTNYAQHLLSTNLNGDPGQFFNPYIEMEILKHVPDHWQRLLRHGPADFVGDGNFLLTSYSGLIVIMTFDESVRLPGNVLQQFRDHRAE